MENKCVYCGAFETFKELSLEGMSMEDAFHEAAKEVVAQAVSDSFDEGYIAAMLGLRDLAQRTIEDIYSDGECDCDECTCD